MVFIVNSAFCLTLIAIALGVFLIAKAAEETPKKKLLKVVGYIVTVAAVLSLLCVVVNTFCLEKTLKAPCPLLQQQQEAESESGTE